jgi:putative transposase
MPRTARAVEAGLIYHVLNRGNGRMRLFHKPQDYAAFQHVLAQALQRYPVDLLSYCLMPNHWHLVLCPRIDTALARFVGWLGVTHVRRHHQHYANHAGGHLYQGRYKSFPVRDDLHLLTLCRYVEANPLRADLVPCAERWRYSSLWQRLHPTATAPLSNPKPHPSPPHTQLALPRLADWPVDRPSDWLEVANEPLAPPTLSALRTCVTRGRPWGDDAWVQRIAHRLGLLFTLRNPGRPRKTPPDATLSTGKRPQGDTRKRGHL